MTFLAGFALGLVFPVFVRVIRRSLSQQRRIGGNW